MKDDVIEFIMSQNCNTWLQYLLTSRCEKNSNTVTTDELKVREGQWYEFRIQKGMSSDLLMRWADFTTSG